MNLELFTLGDYGHFIWPAFIFTFLSCFFLYLKTKKELIKQEKIFFHHFKQSQVIKIKTEKSTKKSLSAIKVF